VPANPEERRFNIHATPEMMAGVYANFANVSHSDYEFSLTFMRLDHETKATKRSRRRSSRASTCRRAS